MGCWAERDPVPGQPESWTPVKQARIPHWGLVPGAARLGPKPKPPLGPKTGESPGGPLDKEHGQLKKAPNRLSYGQGTMKMRILTQQVSKPTVRIRIQMRRGSERQESPPTPAGVRGSGPSAASLRAVGLLHESVS